MSDETLFLRMSQGDRFAQSILLHRYEYAGFQCFRVLARQFNVYNYKPMDFIDIIDETIYKSFRYYRLNEKTFKSYCYELLNQTLTKQLTTIVSDAVQLKDVIYLDSPICDDSSNSYHDIVEDTCRLSAPEEYSMKEFLENLIKKSDENTRLAIEIYKYHLYGMPLHQIAKKCDVTIYRVRKSVRVAEKLIEEKIRKFRLN